MLKNGNLFAGFFFLLVGIGCALGSLQLPLGTPLDPKPGFFPLLAGIFLSGLSILYLLRAFLKGSPERRTFVAKWRPGLLIIGLFIYSIILDPVGYVVAMIVLSLAILRILETTTWWKLAAISLAASIGSYILFDRILGVNLPLGLLKGFL
jgi:putative tricarboxylic transport membrane protein